MGRRTLTVTLLVALVAMSVVVVLALAALLALGVSKVDALLIVGLPVMGLAAVLVLAFVMWTVNGFRSRRHRRSFDDALWDVSDIWPGCSLGLLALLLVLTPGAGVVAQEPSPESPPWFGGRVEMPEHGFAATVPDGWIAFDPAGDVDEQARVAVMALDPDASADDVAVFAGDLSHASYRGVQLAMYEEPGRSGCGFEVLPPTESDLDTLAELVSSTLSRVERVTVERPRAVELPAGPGVLVAASVAVPDVPGASVRVTSTYVYGPESLLLVACFGVERPNDDWLSIAESVEFLPEAE